MLRIDRLQLLRLGAELILIIVGVLLAFQVDAYREKRDNQSRTLTQLNAIRSELSENLSRLDRVIDLQEVVTTAQITVLRIANSEEPFPDRDEMGQNIRRATMFFRTEPITGAYDSLVASGDLRIIDDPSLRAELATFMEDLRTPFEDEESSLLFRTELFGTFSQYFDYLSIRAPNSPLDFPDPILEPNYEGLLDDQRYLNYLGILTAIESSIARHYRTLREECIELIEKLDAAIAET